MKGILGGLHEKVQKGVEAGATALVHLDLCKRQDKVEDYYDDLKELPKLRAKVVRTYLARHKESGEYRNIRMVPKKYFPPGEFQEEVKIFQSIFHPNIIHLYQTLEDTKTWYFVTDRIDRRNLYQAIPKLYDNPQDFDETEVALVLRTILRALEFCHKKGIAHTNLNYENILVPPKRGLKGLYIVGFGANRIKRAYNEEQNRGTQRIVDSNPMSIDDLFAAPESRSGDLSVFEEPCDIWALGMITYQLLTKHHPYEDPDVTRKSFGDKAWREEHFRNHEFLSNVSAPARDFVKQLLTYKDVERPTAEEACEHEWLKIAEKVTKREKKEEMLDCLDNLTAFDAKNKLQESARIFMATNLLQGKEREALDGIFHHLAKEKKDAITKQALQTAFEKTHGKEQTFKIKQMLEAVFDRLDTEKKGVIDYNHFIAAAADDSILLTKKNLRAAFDAIDISKTGTINAGDLKAFLMEQDGQDSVSSRDIRRIIKQVDTDEDGEINFEDFWDLMMVSRK